LFFKGGRGGIKKGGGKLATGAEKGDGRGDTPGPGRAREKRRGNGGGRRSLGREAGAEKGGGAGARREGTGNSGG